MIKNNYFLFLFCFLFSFVKSQIGDAGYPFLFQKLLIKSYLDGDRYKDNSGNILPFMSLKNNIPFFETSGIDNQNIINEVAQLKDPIYLNQNIYGKAIYNEIDIANPKNRIEYDNRYYNLYRIKSSDAKAIQIYFKKYKLPKEATLYFYNEYGFILGEFNKNNNPVQQDNRISEFGIQPIPGNNFYIELSYPINSTELPELVAEKVIHSTVDFYGGEYGQAGNCHKNIACDFTGTNDKSRNIKSVGLMLYPLYKNGVKQSTYSATCSGNLMNNTKQDGFPYFLTAAHCIGASAANNNMNWSSELITLFNYEAKTCGSGGSDAPSSLSNNSVLGCSVLTQSPAYTGDYALLMLNTTAKKLTEYKVCFAGWDNNPNSYLVNPTNAYGVHHPKGDVKKISYLKDIYPVSSNQGSFLPLDPQGKFLKISWRDGIVEKGSSGSPLFNSFDRMIGSLSTGPDPIYFNCSAPDKYEGYFFNYYSRFSSNYYTMSPWLNSAGSNVQSIGPYCPNTSIQVGAPITVVFPPGGGGNPNSPEAYESIVNDVNGKPIHPSLTFGKKIYFRENRNFLFPNVNAPNTSFEYNSRLAYLSDNMFAASSNLYATRNEQVINKFELWGIYKIVDCNKLKYIKPAAIVVRNPVTAPGEINEVAINVVGITEDKVHILIYSSKRDGNNFYMSYELQTYKVINNELVYVTYYPIATNIQSDPYYPLATNFEHGLYHTYRGNSKNRVLLSRDNQNVNSYFFNEITNTWSATNNVITNQYISKITDDKVFVLTSPNTLKVYKFIPQTSDLQLQTTFSNAFVGNIFDADIMAISKKSNDEYWIIHDKITPGGTYFHLASLNLANNTVSYLPVSDDFSFIGGGIVSFIFHNNEILKIVKGTDNPPTAGDYSSHMVMSFANTNGIWTRNKLNYVKWRDVLVHNNKYLLTMDILNRSSMGNFINVRDWTLGIRELDYINHPYAMHDNVTYYTAAYHRPPKLDHDMFDYGMSNGKKVFKNIMLGVNKFPFKFNGVDNNGNKEYDATTYDVKTVILDNKTAPIIGDKNVSVYAKYSVVMKPGFSVSSSTGAEFQAIPQAPLPVDIPACSFMFDDMLNPKLTETPDETLYLKQIGPKKGNEPYYGEIVLNGNLATQEVVIDKNVRLYPNPTKDILNIDFNGKHFKTVEVYSIDGKKILTQEVSSMNNVEVNLLRYPPGIYMVTLIDSNGKTYPNKVIKK